MLMMSWPSSVFTAQDLPSQQDKQLLKLAALSAT